MANSEASSKNLNTEDEITNSIKDALTTIANIEKIVENIDLQSFDSSSLHSSAVYYQVIVLGHAFNKIPRDFQMENSDVDWGPWIGMRNRLAHPVKISSKIVWESCMTDLPKLSQQLRRLLKQITCRSVFED